VRGVAGIGMPQPEVSDDKIALRHWPGGMSNRLWTDKENDLIVADYRGGRLPVTIKVAT